MAITPTQVSPTSVMLNADKTPQPPEQIVSTEEDFVAAELERLDANE